MASCWAAVQPGPDPPAIPSRRVLLVDRPGSVQTTIFVGFAYYAFLRAGQALGYNGTIPPVGDAYGHRARLAANPIYEYAWAAWPMRSKYWRIGFAERAP